MEDAAEQKMAALKRVYADIILNTAKESAARVLAADRRALKFERDVSVAKEHALATLLRLKSIMDSKIREAETASTIQVRRIQELEAQLNEAQNKVTSLRTELNVANNELVLLKNNGEEPYRQSTNDHVASCADECQDNSSFDPAKSSVGLTLSLKNATTEDLYHSIGNVKQTESTKVLSTENDHAGNPDLASVIMGSKEPELYRNGCTQRIRAFEQNFMNAKVSLRQNDCQFSDLKGDIICEKGEDGRPCSKAIGIPDKIVSGGKIPPESEKTEQHASSIGNRDIFTFCCQDITRRKRGKRNHRKPTNSGILLNQEKADREPSEVVSFNKSLDRKMSPQLSVNSASARLLQCGRMAATRQNIMKQSHSDCENQVEHIPSFSTKNIDCGTNIRDSLLETDKNDGLPTGSDQSDVDNTLQPSLFETPDRSITENSNIELHKGNPETSVLTIADSDDKFGDRFGSSGSSQAGSNKFLKYTFQRKRKRNDSAVSEGKMAGEQQDTLLKPQKSTTENDSAVSERKRMRKKKNTLLESQKSSTVKELPREHRRMMQVARQLISLSERRW